MQRDLKDKAGEKKQPQSDFLLPPRPFGLFFYFRYFILIPALQLPFTFPRASFFFLVTHDAFYRSIPVVSSLRTLHSDAYAVNKKRCVLLQLPKICSSIDETMHTNSHPQKQNSWFCQCATSLLCIIKDDN